MDQLKGQSYMDLTVMPAMRDCVLSHQPVVIFDDALEEVIWSNATGAQLFGGNGIADLLAMRIPQTNPLIRQLRHAVEQMGNDDRIVRGFQINQGKRSQLLQFSIERITSGSDEVAFKVTHLPGDDVAAPTQQEIYQFVADAFTGLASATAILDRNGAVLASSEGFEALSPEQAELASLVDELQYEADRLIKRPLQLGEDRLIVIGLARLGVGNEPNLMVIAEPIEESVEQTDDSDPVVQQKEADELEASNDLDLPSPETTIETVEPESIEPAYPDAEALVEDTEFTAIEDPTPPAKTAAADTRFAWSVDENAVFTSVSDEMAGLFRLDKENLLGRSWHDFADEYDLDPDREIADLLASRDTWSGKVFLWPLEDDGGEYAIELAALPAFDQDRNFSGFRGFGKILHRVLDVSEEMSDEDGGIESSVELSNQDPFDEEPEIAIEAPPESEIETGNLPEDGDLPEDNDGGVVSEADGASETESNVLPFSRTADRSQNLSEREQQALEAVRNHLEDRLSEEDQQSENDEANVHKLPPVTTRLPRSSQPGTDILEQLPVAVLIYRDEELLYGNQKFFEASGYASISEISDAGGLPELIGGELSEEGNANTLLFLANGQSMTINPILHSVPWDEGKALLLSFAATGVAPVVEADVLEITRSAEIQSILDTTNDGIILLEDNGDILSINASAEALFGIEFDDAIGQRLETLFAPESQDTIRGYVANVIGDGVERLINDGEEAIALESSGGYIPVFITIAKMHSTGKLCAVLRDITHWKKTEEELIQSRKHAEDSNAQKSEFLAKVSHEIRTPLNAIIGFSDVMIEERFGPIGNERYREYLQDIKRSGSHVLDIVNELLDLSRIEAGKLELTFEAVDLNEVVAETVALLQPEANTNRTIIRTSLSRSVPKVVADPRSIRQIILNLVSNAIKYSRSNSQVIVSTVYETNGEVALRVRDTGDGMTGEQIEDALQPFRQAHDLKENIEGSGLGLPLTKALVEANRAYFELESEPGMGTIAHVQFPVQRVLGE